MLSVFGLSRFKNEEYTLCLACLGYHALRTKNMHCVKRVQLGYTLCLACLGYHALRTKNMHCVKRVWAITL